MQENILRSSNVTKIYLTYVESGIKQKFEVKFKYMDSKECYFTTPMGINFHKPKNRTPIELSVYTIDGIYKTSVVLRDTTTSIHEILFQLSIPIQWDFVQLRDSTRVEVALNFSIKFNDGFEIKGQTFDVATGGISYYSKAPISSIYKKVSGILTLEFPAKSFITLPGKKLVKEVKFVREKAGSENIYQDLGSLYVFRILSLTPEEAEEIKHFLITIS